LNSNTRTELNNFGVATLASSDDASLTLSYQTDGIRAGSYISVGNGTTEPESMYVRSRNGLAIEVIRGVDGSAPAVWGTDALIEVEPRFTEHQILEAVRDSIRAMPNNLYAVDTTDVSFSTTQQSITTPFPYEFTQVLSATRTARASEDRLLKFNVKVQEYAGAYKVVRQEGIEKAITVQLTYAHPFVTATLDPVTSLEDVVKMQVELQDIPALGAAATLILGEESLRLDLHSQGDSRSDAAVAAGDRARYSLVLQAQYDRRVSQEARRLMAKYGIRADAATSSVFPTTVR